MGCGPVRGGGLHLGRGPRILRQPAGRRQKEKLHLKHQHWLTYDSRIDGNANQHQQMLICHFGLQNAGEQAPMMHCLEEAQKPVLPLRRQPCFHMFPRQGSAKVYCPRNPTTAPCLQHCKDSYSQSSSPDGKIIPLNSYTVIASKCFVFVLRCSVSPLSLVFSQLNLWFAFSSFMF